ncbi:MAG TPA: DNA repair protein RecO [Haliangiales bacterium]|nr:DNA repair protein RecO [Haliangiales bacterium]
MAENTRGLILRTRPLTETSLIVHWLTPEFGRIATVAKGARRARSPFRGKLDLLYLADFSFSRSRRSELHTLREAVLRDTHPSLREEIAYLQQASYCAALIEQTTETETPLPAIYGLLIDLLDSLPKQSPHPETVFAFEMKLLSELGLKPDLTRIRLTVGAKKIAKALIEMDWRTISRIKLNGSQNTELRQFLHGHLIFHLGKLPKGRNAALAVKQEAALPRPAHSPGP